MSGLYASLDAVLREHADEALRTTAKQEGGGQDSELRLKDSGCPDSSSGPVTSNNPTLYPHSQALLTLTSDFPMC